MTGGSAFRSDSGATVFVVAAVFEEGSPPAFLSLPFSAADFVLSAPTDDDLSPSVLPGAVEESTAVGFMVLATVVSDFDAAGGCCWSVVDFATLFPLSPSTTVVEVLVLLVVEEADLASKAAGFGVLLLLLELLLLLLLSVTTSLAIGDTVVVGVVVATEGAVVLDADGAVVAGEGVAGFVFVEVGVVAGVSLVDDAGAAFSYIT